MIRQIGREIGVAGGVAGLLGGLAMTLLLVIESALIGDGAWVISRAVAAAVYGVTALVGGAGPAIVGTCLLVGTGVVLGVPFAAVVGTTSSVATSLGAALIYALVLWLTMTYAVLPVIDPPLTARVGLIPSTWLAAHVLYALPLALAPRFRRDLRAPPSDPLPAPA